MAINFKSPGAAAQRALRDFLLEREVQRRQQMLDGIMLTNTLADRARAETADRRARVEQQQADADRLAVIHGPAAELAPDVAEAMAAGGYRINTERTLPARTVAMPVGDGVSTEARELPSTMFSRRAERFDERVAREQRESATAERNEARRFRDEQADTERAFRGEQAELTRQQRTEQAAADRELKALIAQMSQSNNLETRALGNELKRLQIAAAEDKLEAGRQERARTETDARTTTQTALELAKRLLDPNDVGAGIGAATGAYEVRGFTQGAQDFNAVRDQLIAFLTKPNLGALKGPMSDKDVVFVKQLATRLANTKMSKAETIRAIQDATEFLDSKMRGGAGSDDGWIDMGGGVRVRRR